MYLFEVHKGGMEHLSIIMWIKVDYQNTFTGLDFKI